MNNVPNMRYLDSTVVEVCLVGNVHVPNCFSENCSGLASQFSILWDV